MSPPNPQKELSDINQAFQTVNQIQFDSNISFQDKNHTYLFKNEDHNSPLRTRGCRRRQCFRSP